MSKTKEQLQAEISALNAQLSAITMSEAEAAAATRQAKQKAALALAETKIRQIEAIGAEIEAIAVENEIYIRWDGIGSYDSGGAWTPSGGWESSSANC